MQKMLRASRILAVLLLVTVAFSGCSLFKKDAKYIKTVVDGDSMKPTLISGQQIRVQKTKIVTYGDIIIFEFQKDVYHVKRVIAAPGDAIRFQYAGGKYDVYLNDELLEEDYTLNGTPYWYSEKPKELTVGYNEYFVMGDNRAESNDSRHNGCINKSQIFGKVVGI